jgi:membrane protease YdiL (CAAX protease family)
MFLTHAAHFRSLGAENLKTFWFVDGYVVQTALVLASLLFSLQILRLSTYRPNWEDVLWLALGFLVNSLPFPGIQRAELSHQVGLWPYVVILVVYGPIVEELFVRGIFLRSLIERFSKIVAVLGVSLIWALDHVNFWASLPLQLTICIIYVWRKNSLSASIACHVGGNLAALVFYSKIV